MYDNWEYHNIPACRQEVFAQFIGVVKQENLHYMFYEVNVEGWISAQVLISPYGKQLIARYFENKT